MDTIAAIRLFFEVADMGSFSAVARTHQIAISSITRVINQLERSLGATLFIRSTRQLSLTEAGYRLLQSRGQLAQLAETLKAIKGVTEDMSGRMRITAPENFGRRYLVDIIPALLDEFSGLEIELDLSDEYRDLVTQGIDMSIRVGEDQSLSLIQHQLTPNTHVLCASPNYLSRYGVPKEVGDLKNHRCIRHEILGLDKHWVFSDETGVTYFLPEGSFSSNLSDAVISAAISSQGIILMPYWLVGAELIDGRLAPVMATSSARPLPKYGEWLYIAYPPHNRHSIKVQTVKERLIALLCDVGYPAEAAPDIHR
ncbi:LysR family transcriptional regulator [Burkholderia sp. D-99]|uniref:LysR family transcriptional regulator n=1 Tax=Burkholderia sp. D-99 TaxID=2717316 RepID=UPI00141E1267|nr:LysR family transcriptional regulator [Burkholderia sp. D-99]NHV24862.1 LysR family transcriptional regulator [Burkholderia sp. D-99]